MRTQAVLPSANSPWTSLGMLDVEISADCSMKGVNANFRNVYKLQDVDLDRLRSGGTLGFTTTRGPV